jgi:hypothetical protein
MIGAHSNILHQGPWWFSFTTESVHHPSGWSHLYNNAITQWRVVSILLPVDILKNLHSVSTLILPVWKHLGYTHVQPVTSSVIGWVPRNWCLNFKIVSVWERGWPIKTLLLPSKARLPNYESIVHRVQSKCSQLLTLQQMTEKFIIEYCKCCLLCYELYIMLHYTELYKLVLV